MSQAVEYFDIARIAAAVILLAVASRSDWRTRTAEDWTWIILGLLGIVLMFATLANEGWPPAAYAGPLLLLVVLLDVFVDRPPLYDAEKRKVGWAGIGMTAAGLIMLYAIITSPMDLEQKGFLLGPLVMIYFFYLLYIVNVIHGGADVKALMVLSVLFPAYPHVGNLPLWRMGDSLGEMVFPFSFLILFFAALTTLAVPFFLLAYNASRGDMRFPMALLGYKKDLSETGFCWPMERVVDGTVVRRYRPSKGMDVDAEFQALREAGRTEAWVTPKIPFLIPMLAGLLLAIVLGNPFSIFM